MWLIGLKTRVRKVDRGWIVEIEKHKWYGVKYWTHLISVNGIREEAWIYSSKEIAIKEAVKYFEWDLLTQTNRGNNDR